MKIKRIEDRIEKYFGSHLYIPEDRDDKAITICKEYDTAWSWYTINLHGVGSFLGEEIAWGRKLSDIKKFLEQFNSSDELVGRWFLNKKKVFEA